MARTNTCLPMLATEAVSISSDTFKQTISQLSEPEQLEKLATDVRFFKQQTGSINSIVGHLQQASSDKPACRQLFAGAPQLLRQLVVITTAALQQLARQRDSEVQVSKATGMLATSLASLLPVLGGRSAGGHTEPTPADTATLRMMHDTGLLKAYAAAATTAASFFASNPQLPRASSHASALQAADHLLDNPAHVLAASSTYLVSLWNALMQTVPFTELLSAQSLMHDTALPTATLGMALARAYACDNVYCATVMSHVLAACGLCAGAATSGLAGVDGSALARQEVYGLLLLGLAVGTGLLHAELKGTSTQTLPPSMRTHDRAASSSSSSGSAGQGSSSSKCMAVSAHHELLLQALVGVRQLAGLSDNTAATVSKQMCVIPLAVTAADSLRYRNAGISSSSSSGSARLAVRESELVPWKLVLPLVLTQMELLALAPPCITGQLSVLQQLVGTTAGVFEQLRSFTHEQHWRLVQQQLNWPSLDTVRSQLQLCAESVWLQLGPALLVLCRRRSGEAVGEEEEQPDWTWTTTAGETLGAAPPRLVFETFSELLMEATSWSVPVGHGPTIDLAAVVKQNPLLACCVLEAALHAYAAYSGPPGIIVDDTRRLHHASKMCVAAAAAVPTLTDVIAKQWAAAADQHAGEGPATGATTAVEAAGGQQPAAAAVLPAHDGKRVERKLFCALIAALKYTQASAALQGPAEAAMHSYYDAAMLLCACCSAVVRLLQSCSPRTISLHSMPASAQVAAARVDAHLQSEWEQQLLTIHVLGRSLAAAASLLQQVPSRVSASGKPVLADNVLSETQQLAMYAELFQMLTWINTAYSSFGVLRYGAEVASDVAAGFAAATEADLARLFQQARGLQEQVNAVAAVFEQIGNYDAPGMELQQYFVGNQAMQKLHASCQEGGLPQQLRSFGVAYCAAFPQRGCCGNPACTNLDKFTETALASRSCSGCSKAVKFCSPACHRTAWKQGHKAACAVLKQRDAAAEASATQHGA